MIEEGQSSMMMLSCERVVNQEKVNEEIRCRICLGILWDPKECKVCETCFCGPCLDQWLSIEGHKCPLKCSEEPEFKERAHKIIRNMLSDLNFRCKNSHSGCQEIVEYSKILDHERTCDFDLKECSGKEDGCTTVLTKRELTQHEANCPLVPVECEYCKRMVKRFSLRSHYMACEEAELECEMCHGIFKKKNYPIHVNALCEENIMNCGKCSGTYKRKYKQYHDCVRHLQNCQKTMNEEITGLKKRLIEKDKRINELESRVFYEMADIRAQIELLAVSRNSEHHPLSQRPEIDYVQTSDRGEVLELGIPPTNVIQEWNFGASKLFQKSLQTATMNSTAAIFDLKKTEQSCKPQDMIFGFIHSATPLQPQNSSHQLEVDISLYNIATSFIPMYYIVGVVSDYELEKLAQLDTFDSIYSLLNQSSTFLPSFGKSFSEKLRLTLKLKVAYKEHETLDQQEALSKFEVEDNDKQQKLKVVDIDWKSGGCGDRYLFFGIYCSQAVHLQNHKEIKVKLYQ